MNKDELKAYLQNMQLDPELWTSLTALIEKAPVVDQKLLDTIADVLDLQADFYEKTAALLEQQAVNGVVVPPSDVQIKTDTQQQQQQVIDQLQQLAPSPLTQQNEQAAPLTSALPVETQGGVPPQENNTVTPSAPSA